MNKRSFANLWYAVVLAVLLALVLSAGVAAGTARVYVQRVDAASEDSVAVEVVATGVVDLYGAEVHLRYDPQVLAVQDADPQQEGLQVEPGTLLSPQEGFVVANKVDEQAGTVLYAITLVNPAQPVSGDGVLARVNFKKLGAGHSTIAVEEAKLVAHSLELLPLETSSLEVGSGSLPIAGVGEVAAEVGGSKIWALGLIVLAGMVVSAGAWFLSRQRKPLIQSGPSQVKTRADRGTTGPQSQQRPRQPSQPTLGSPASLVRQGQTALAAGDVSGAYRYFSEAVELDPYNLSAWMGKAQTTRSEKEREICLQRARELSNR